MTNVYGQVEYIENQLTHGKSEPLRSDPCADGQYLKIQFKGIIENEILITYG